MTGENFPRFTAAAKYGTIPAMDLADLFPPDAYRFDDTGRSPALFWRGGPVLLTPEICDALVAAGRRMGGQNLRICLHADQDDPLQEMIVLTWRGGDIPPHYHPSKTESLHIIRGRIRVHLYDNDGTRIDSFELEPQNKPFISLPPGACHESEVLSEYSLFHEIKLGTSDSPEANVLPSWVKT